MTLFGLAQLMNPILLRVEDKAYLDALAAPHERMPQAAAAGE
jgi:hypothetical protein